MVSALDFDTFANSKLGLTIAAGIGKATPRAIGLRLAEQAADILAARTDSAIARAVRSNRWVVSGGTLSGEALDDAVRETLRNSARFVYDFYRFAEDPSALRERVRVSEGFREWMERVLGGEPVVIGAPHLANFDLAGRALALEGFRAQVLSVPDPNDAYRAQNEARRKAGLEVTPVSPASLRQAFRRLTEGGAVLTGVDRPLAEGGAMLRFFGRKARLPDVHVRLAGRTGAPFVFLWVLLAEDGAYCVECEEVRLSGGREAKEVEADCEAVLALAEREIARSPGQWAMPHPVWPEALRELELAEAGGRAEGDV